MQPNSTVTLVLALVLAVGLAVLTAWVWNRLRRPWLAWPVRVLALLACVLVALGSALVGVNLKVDVYTDWAQLFGTDRPAAPAGHPAVVSHGAGGSQVVMFTVTGQESHITVPAYAYLPPGYGSPEHAHTVYPVIEAVDGFPGSPNTWLVGLHATHFLDKEILTGRMAPTVAIFPYQYTNPAHDGECVNAVGGQQWETFLTKDVRTATAEQFRVRTDRAGWGLVGTSTGGFCAANLALRNPDLYAATASLSGYFTAIRDSTTGDLYRGNVLLREQNSPLWRIKHLPVPDLAMYLGVAVDDHAGYNQFLAFTAAAHPPLQLTTVTVAQGGHTGGVWIVLEPSVYDWLSGWLAAPEEEGGPNT